MSGIDKLEIVLRESPETRTVLGCPLATLISNAEAMGYRVETFYRRDNRNPAKMFYAPTAHFSNSQYGNIIVEYARIALPYTSDRTRHEVATKIICNPSHFSGLGLLLNVLEALGGEEDWTGQGYISRIDFAADYSGDFQEWLSGIDVASRRIARAYLGIESGRTTGMYWGSNHDVLVLYDRTALYNELGIEDSLFTGNLRVERQISRPSNIRRLFGYLHPATLSMLPDMLEQIIHGEVSPLEGVTIGHITLPELTLNNLASFPRLIRLDERCRLASYGYMRRSNVPQPLMRMIVRRLDQDTDQPPSVLARSIEHFQAATFATVAMEAAE